LTGAPSATDHSKEIEPARSTKPLLFVDGSAHSPSECNAARMQENINTDNVANGAFRVYTLGAAKACLSANVKGSVCDAQSGGDKESASGYVERA